MLENCKSAQERWGGVHDIVDRWLKERQELLVQYYDLTQALDAGPDDESGHDIQALCQILVDYVSAGHFEVYGQLLKEARDFNDEAGLEKGKALFKEVEKTTDFCLDFNDKYQATDDLDDIMRDLSTLGEMLANRFEWEDQMIEVLHNAHADQLA